MRELVAVFERNARVTDVTALQDGGNGKKASDFNDVTAVTPVTAVSEPTDAQQELADRAIAAGGIVVIEPATGLAIARFEQGAPPGDLLAELRAAGWKVLVYGSPEERLEAAAARALDPALVADPAETTLRGEVGK